MPTLQGYPNHGRSSFYCALLLLLVWPYGLHYKVSLLSTVFCNFIIVLFNLSFHASDLLLLEK